MLNFVTVTYNPAVSFFWSAIWLKFQVHVWSASNNTFMNCGRMGFLFANQCPMHFKVVWISNFCSKMVGFQHCIIIAIFLINTISTHVFNVFKYWEPWDSLYYRLLWQPYPDSVISSSSNLDHSMETPTLQNLKVNQIWYTVKPILKDHLIGHKNVVSQDRWSLVTSSIRLKCWSFCCSLSVQ